MNEYILNRVQLKRKYLKKIENGMVGNVLELCWLGGRLVVLYRLSDQRGGSPLMALSWWGVGRGTRPQGDRPVCRYMTPYRTHYQVYSEFSHPRFILQRPYIIEMMHYFTLPM